MLCGFRLCYVTVCYITIYDDTRCHIMPSYIAITPCHTNVVIIYSAISDHMVISCIVADDLRLKTLYCTVVYYVILPCVKDICICT